ncbi:MAG: transcriptional regulator [Bacteroidetes bacterium 4572_114]|nr:MAG: transcriptional regulator [Bacteroidetes bacterium 4572_114]
MKKNNHLTPFESLLTEKYGEPGASKRDEFEKKAKAFVIGELLKEERKQAKLTQEELASRIGAKKSYISKIENGKTDIQVTLHPKHPHLSFPHQD